MVKELHTSMSRDLDDILKDDGVQDAFAKIEKLADESTASANKDAWLVR